MKKLIVLLLLTLIVGSLAACGSSNTSAENGEKHVKIGITGSSTPYWDIIKKKAKEKGIEIELVTFSDYILPNKALANKELDMNSFQHLAFLGPFNVEHNLDIVPIGSTTINPTGLYSNKHENVSQIPNGAKIAVSDDPANLGRGLLLLETAGLIKLKEGVGIYGTLEDIKKNPKNLKIITMVSQQTARALQDVDASLINSGIAGQAGLTPDEAIIHDDPHSKVARPYVNVLAVRPEDKDNKVYKTIAKLYQEPKVIEAVKKDTNGGSIVVDLPVKDLQETLNQLMEKIKERKKK
jgi:D-methionine transport system substrate-binding protein